MEILSLPQGNSTPKVLFDAKKGLFSIAGKSMPEDAESFYNPVINYMQEFKDSQWVESNPIQLDVMLEYYNSASMRFITDLLLVFMEIYKSNNKNVKVTWFYDDGDDLLKEAGEELAEMLDIPFYIEMTE